MLYARTENGVVTEVAEWDAKSPHPFKDHLFRLPEGAKPDDWIGLPEKEAKGLADADKHPVKPKAKAK